MAIPHRGWTSNSIYFITASVSQKKFLFQAPPIAELLLDVLLHYRAQQKYLLHEFVVMPNHFHLLITPEQALERAVQLIKGGFSFRIKKELGFGGEVWQSSYYDHRVRDEEEYSRIRTYIQENPVRAGMVSSPMEYAYGSAMGRWVLDEVPQRLKPHGVTVGNSQG
jgi:putative transposase